MANLERKEELHGWQKLLISNAPYVAFLSLLVSASEERSAVYDDFLFTMRYEVFTHKPERFHTGVKCGVVDGGFNHLNFGGGVACGMSFEVGCFLM